MSIETLITPNPIRYPGVPTMPFLQAAGLVSCEGGVPDAPPTVDTIQHATRDSLHYPETQDDWIDQPNPYPLDTLDRWQQADCIGYTTVGAQALRMAGIEYYIGYGREHFMLLLPQDDRLYYRDMLLPEFNNDISSHLLHGTPSTIADGLVANPTRQQNVMLDTTVFADTLNMDTDTLAESYQRFWVSRRPNVSYSAVMRGNHSAILRRAETRHHESMQWVMSVYEPTVGEHVMKHYSAFMHAVRIGDLAVAIASTEQLAGIFPENDCRDPHKHIRSLVKQLTASPEIVEDAEDVIEAYTSSIQTGDARAYKLRADLYRVAATASIEQAPKRAERAARLAADNYDLASKTSKVAGSKTSLIEQKSKLLQMATAASATT